MKRLLITLLAISSMAFAYAQEGGIIYTDFEPDLGVAQLEALDNNDTLKIDLDHNGTMDFLIFIRKEPTSPLMRHVYITTASSEWTFRPNFDNIFEHDTVVSNPPYPAGWGVSNSPWQLLWDSNYMEKMIGFHKVDGNDNYYAWAKIYFYIDGHGHHPSYGEYELVYAFCDCMAYCTIPDYPLRWGQTDLTWGVEEDGEPFVAIHPNPANDSFTLTGEQLSEARLYSVTGQLVGTKQGNGTESLTMDISDLSSGLYFVTAIGKDGQKCVQKVVKQ